MFVFRFFFYKRGRDFASLIPWFLKNSDWFGHLLQSRWLPFCCPPLLTLAYRSRKRPLSNKSRYESRRITTLLLWELSAPIESSLPTAASGQSCSLFYCIKCWLLPSLMWSGARRPTWESRDVTAQTTTSLVWRENSGPNKKPAKKS